MSDAGFLTIHEHTAIRRRLADAVEAGSFPQSLLLSGPRGVGKQRLALWVAAALNCRGGPPRPCHNCLSCRLAGRLEHPDIHWFFPQPRPKGASSPEKLAEKLEDQRAEILAERRSNPLYSPDDEVATGIYVATVRMMRRMATATPAMGPNKVFVIGDADGLISQRGSPEAANATLKLLEEPPSDTIVILTSQVRGSLLPTIRSRVQTLRVPPLTVDQVHDFLQTNLDLDDPDAETLARRSRGSIGRALEMASEEYDDLRSAAVTLAHAMLSPEPRNLFTVAHDQRPAGARGTFSRVLTETAEILRDLLADISGASSSVSDPDAVRALQARHSQNEVIAALERLSEARELAERNINPQLIVVKLSRQNDVMENGTRRGPGGTRRR